MNASKVVKAVAEAGEIMTTMETESAAFAEGNKAAGTRLRKAAMDMKTKAHEIRQLVSDAKG